MAWKKGQSGNPGGRSKARQELGDAFVRVLKSDWEEHGAATVIEMREKDPVQYVKVVAAMLPEQVELDVGDGVTELLTLVNEARRKRSAPEAPVGMEPIGADTIRH
jgi:hypothetical protein